MNNMDKHPGSAAALTPEAAQELRRSLHPDWTVVRDHHLEREFKFGDFQQALRFTNRVAELAESQGHHPDIYLAWGRVGLSIWTHSVDGLTGKDFALAARVDGLGLG